MFVARDAAGTGLAQFREQHFVGPQGGFDAGVELASAEEFAGAIREAAVKTRTDLQLLEERRQPVDHPVLPAFPEGRYLKFFVYRKAD